MKFVTFCFQEKIAEPLPIATALIFQVIRFTESAKVPRNWDW